ncbi:unnamed protein product [Vicia faba]|uniref:Leucine-rich repeat-containing N-terminal plant-type domain-containing protein n=1 Tax=Vicia faba TaxID=3906 RepID=A0AAV0YLU4_VICFA|nr:unnamed protein product [Vicia faba]
MGWFLMWLHLFLIHFPSFSSSSSSFNFLCHHDESSALLQFTCPFLQVESSSFLNSYPYFCDEYLAKTKTWINGTDCCSWVGVTCDTISGHVIGLNLGCEGLEGVIYPNSTLFHLSHLQILNLSSNSLSAYIFYFKFDEFPSLTYLDLTYCDFIGEIPSQISHLSKLTSLRLSENNELSWKETTLKRLMQNATNLKELFLDGTNMHSVRPNSIDFLFNHSSSLSTLNLGNTGLRRNFKKRILCLPSIQELYLSGNDFRGQLPEFSCNTFLRILDLSECQLQGPISLSFSNLTHLNSLTLTGNNLNGELPTSLSNFQHLIHLDLSFNLLSGQIPDVFGRMNKLHKLRIRSNNLKGQLPSSLFNLTKLTKLDCSYNKLEASLPNKLTGFQKLIHLRLSHNFLNGTFPFWLLSLPSLIHLDLSNNLFTGHIGAISSYSLEEISLCGNKLQGNIPKSIFDLANLNILCLSSNNLSGVVDFQHFTKFQNLYSLSLSYNSHLSLSFESNVIYNFSQLRRLELSSLNLTTLPKLSENSLRLIQYLDLSNNKINGTVPNWLLERVSLEMLNLSQNLFTSMDEISSNNYQFDHLDLSSNLLHGELSMSICNLISLRILNMANNKLTGPIPQCVANFPYLQVLDLQVNKFHGTLPSKFSQYCQLHELNLNDNQLEGHLPKSLSQCEYLEVLNLGNNKIEDNFPDWLQTLQQLNVLVLRDNKLNGLISNIKFKHPFPRLMIFDISGNNFSGLLPTTYLRSFQGRMIDPQGGDNSNLQYMDMQLLNSTLFYDSVSVRIKGINSTLVKISRNFATIDMSRNKFEGDIPDVVGEFHALIGLNLSHNSLTGIIPRSMGNMTTLESLDLSSNILSGVIPAELSNLNFLEFLDLSNNHLVGDIPQGKQFNTFSNDSYEGNSGLCGLPLSKKCGPEQQSPPSPDKLWSEEKFGFGWKPVAIGYGCGFVFGIGLGYCMFLFGKPRWLVMIFGGQPKRRVKRRTRVRMTNGSTMDQMIQMS